MPGIDPFQLAGVDIDKANLASTIFSSSVFGKYGAIPFYCPAVMTVAGTTTYDLWPTTSGVPFPEGILVTRVRGIMRGAGAGGMTLVLQHYALSTGTGTAISDTISLAALADQDTFEEAKLNDGQMYIPPGDTLRIVTANDPLTWVFVEAIKI